MVEGLDFAFLDGVFGYFHEAVYLLDVDILDVVAPGFWSLSDDFR